MEQTLRKAPKAGKGLWVGAIIEGKTESGHAREEGSHRLKLNQQGLLALATLVQTMTETAKEYQDEPGRESAPEVGGADARATGSGACPAGATGETTATSEPAPSGSGGQP